VVRRASEIFGRESVPFCEAKFGVSSAVNHERYKYLNMSFKDFRVLETIGKGSFASVYKVSIFLRALRINLVTYFEFVELVAP
jgi:hypothetical protein